MVIDQSGIKEKGTWQELESSVEKITKVIASENNTFEQAARHTTN
jgi:hypothetical protein